MLSQTKEEMENLLRKVRVLDFVLDTLNKNHKDYSVSIEEQYKRASFHKLKLTDEILRLAGAIKLEVVETPTIVA